MWPAVASKLRHKGMVHPADSPNQLAKVDATRLATASRVELVGRNHLMWLSNVVKQGIPWMMGNDCKIVLVLCQPRLMTVTSDW